MKTQEVFFITLLTLAMTACSNSSDDSPTLDDGSSPGVAVTPATPGSETPGSDADTDTDSDTDLVLPTTLLEPTFQGELPFDSVTTVDLDPFLEAEGFRSVNATSYLSRDGKTVLVELNNDNEYSPAAIATVDADTGTPSWLATDISLTTRMLFDANYQPVAVAGVACQPVSYAPTFNNSLMDISSLVPADLCIAEAPRVSADGNVVLFNTYDPETSTQYIPKDGSFYAYTLDTANLLALPDITVSKDSVVLSPRSQLQFMNDQYLSDDGQQLLAKTWWEGTDDNGGTLRQVSAVLWNTTTGDWQTRGLRDDLRGCRPTEKVSCDPPYSYVMSNDGSAIYAEIPTDELLDRNDGSPFTEFRTFVEKTDPISDTPVELSDVENIGTLEVNNDGSLILFYALTANDAMPEGYNLYQPETGEHVSLNRALNSCAETDEAGDPVVESSCQYTSVPSSINNEGEAFAAGGSSLTINSVSRMTDDNEQSVKSFVLDVNTGAMFTLPRGYSTNPRRMSADASVFIGISEYPDYDMLIGRR